MTSTARSTTQPASCLWRDRLTHISIKTQAPDTAPLPGRRAPNGLKPSPPLIPAFSPLRGEKENEFLWHAPLNAYGLDPAGHDPHIVCMKRTNLVLDEDVLAEATKLGGQKTYSATVNAALRDFVRRIRARGILSLRGSGAWQGNLSHMRGDPLDRARSGQRGARQ